LWPRGAESNGLRSNGFFPPRQGERRKKSPRILAARSGGPRPRLSSAFPHKCARFVTCESKARRFTLCTKQPGQQQDGRARRGGGYHLGAIRSANGQRQLRCVRSTSAGAGEGLGGAIQAICEVGRFLKFITVTTVTNAKGELIAMNRNRNYCDFGR